MDDMADSTQSRGKYVRFNPTINAGHILTALTIAITGIGAWMQLRSDVNMLTTANQARQEEIAKVELKQENDKKDFFSRMESTQTAMNQSVVELRSEITAGFSRIDARLDKRIDGK